MVHFTALATCIVAGIVVPLASAAKEINKPVMWPNLSQIGRSVEAVMPSAEYDITELKRGTLTERCVYEASTKERKYNLQDLTAYNVQFDDCEGQYWVVCRHKDFTQDVETVVSAMAKIPIGIRQYTSEIMLFPGGGASGMAWKTVAFLFHSTGFGVLLHELTHNVDMHGGFQLPDKRGDGTWKDGDGWYSHDENFKMNVGRDKKVPDDYALSTYTEDLAQLPAVALYDYFVQGGMAAYTAQTKTDFNDIIFQSHTIKHQSEHSRHGIDLLRHRDQCSFHYAPSAETQAFVAGGSNSRVIKTEPFMLSAASNKESTDEEPEPEAESFEFRRVKARALNITLARQPERGDEEVPTCNFKGWY